MRFHPPQAAGPCAWPAFLAAIAFSTAAIHPTRAERSDDAAPPLLIQPDELRGRLDDENPRILDTRSTNAYARGHVPGAVRVNLDDWKELSLSDGGLHDADAWAERVGRLGIGRGTRVVVYGDTLPETARVWWLLKYVGVEDAALLDGGWEAWRQAGGPVSTDTPRVSPRPFRPRFQADRLEEIDTLRERTGREGVTVVDTRSDDEFTGRDARGPRGGHVPGAVHLEWKDLLAADGRFKSPEELQRLFRQRGIEPGAACVTYWQTGGRASVEAFALELAGYPRVRVFYRGWQQWSADESAPVEKPQ